MRVLISGFEAFGGRETNPSANLINALVNKEVSYPASMTIEQIILPVDYQDAFRLLEDKITSFNPDVILSFGEAHTRMSIELESTAVNKINSELKDNLGNIPDQSKISTSGPDSYQSTLPIQGFETALKDAGIPVKISNSAGQFVCNYLFYRIMETNQESLRLCGFIHLPLETNLSHSKIKEALGIMLQYLNY